MRRFFISGKRHAPGKFATLVKNWPASSYLLLAGLLTVSSDLHAALNISPSEAKEIGRRVWQNECNGTVAGLTSWNAGEDFASLGIGHFIWYPKNKRGPFDESFPNFVRFAAEHGAKLPNLVASGAPCPWNSRAEFESAKNSGEMKQLRDFLASTIDLQAQFLVERLEQALPKMLAQARDPENVRRQFSCVSNSGHGCYALVDYVNFKGEGTLATERYKGEGWGLLQVLENMHGDDPHSALDEFAASAKNVLRRRVTNSPPERGEARWLAGWLARINSYRGK